MPIWRWFQTEYWPAHGPWYDGAVWGNVFVIPVAFVLGAILWPPLRKAFTRFVRRETYELHRKLDHIIEHHPDIPPLPPKGWKPGMPPPPPKPTPDGTVDKGWGI